MDRMTAIVATVALSTAISVPAAAAKDVRPPPSPAGDWTLIGTAHAKRTADHDGIVVHGPNDNFRRIKLRVRDAPLNLHRLVVTYDNGSPDEIPVRDNIRQGGESRAIDLRGMGKRSIRRIDFWYDTQGWARGAADVSVYGLR